jgi:hypothetical protein
MVKNNPSFLAFPPGDRHALRVIVPTNFRSIRFPYNANHKPKSRFSWEDLRKNDFPRRICLPFGSAAERKGILPADFRDLSS